METEFQLCSPEGFNICTGVPVLPSCVTSSTGAHLGGEEKPLSALLAKGGHGTAAMGAVLSDPSTPCSHQTHTHLVQLKQHCTQWAVWSGCMHPHHHPTSHPTPTGGTVNSEQAQLKCYIASRYSPQLPPALTFFPTLTSKGP